MCFADQKKAKGEELFDQIMYHLDIIEKDYFGLRFMDSAQVPVRLETQITQTSCTTCQSFLLEYTNLKQSKWVKRIHQHVRTNNTNYYVLITGKKQRC